MNEIYIVDGKTYEVSLNNVERFLQDFPNAMKQPSIPTLKQPKDIEVVEDIDTSKGGLFFSKLQRMNPSIAFPLAVLASLGKGTADISDLMSSGLETQGEIIGGKDFSGLGKAALATAASGGLLLSRSVSASAQSDEGLSAHIARRLAAQKAGVTLEEYDETNPYNIFEVKTLSNAIDKATVKYIDKNTGKRLDFLDLFEAGEYTKSAESFVYETAAALPSLIVSRMPWGYALLGGGAFAKKLNTDLFERPDQTSEKILSNALIYGGSDAIGEYMGGRYLNKLAGAVKNRGKAGLKNAKDVMINGIGGIIKTGIKGGSYEALQESITSVIQSISDQEIYGDDISLAQHFRKALHAGMIGFALGKGSGMVSGGMNVKNKTKVYEYLAPKSYKNQQAGLFYKLEEAQQDLENAPTSKKEKFQRVVDKVQKAQGDLREQLYDRFETMQKEDPKSLELMIDKIQEQHDNLDIINGGKNYSETAKDQAKKDFKEAASVVGDLFAVTDINYDADIELKLSKYFRVAEDIDKANEKLWFKSKDLNYEYVDNQEKYDELKKQYGSDIMNSAEGFFEVTEGGKRKIFINRDVAAMQDASNVIGHELLHYAMSHRFANDPKFLRESVVAFNEYLDEVSPYIKKSIENRLANPKNGYAKLDVDGKVQRDEDGLIVMNNDSWIEEYFTMFSDLIKNEKIDVVEDASTGIKNKFRTMVRGLGLGFNKVDFKSGKEVFDLLIDYNKNIDRTSLLRAITQKKAIETVAGKKVKKAEPTQKLSKTASDNVQSIYEEQGEAGAMDIIEQFKPITSKIVERRSEAPNFDRQLLTDEIETGKRGIFDLIREYDPKSGVPLAAYINKFLPARAIEASKRVLGEEFTEDVTERVDIAAEEVVEPTVTKKPKRKKIVLAEKLGITKEVASAINKIVPNLDINKLNFKTLKNQIPEITGKLFGIATKKIEDLSNLTKSELQSAQMFINKNADLLIQMLPEGATASGTATGVPQTLLKAFYTKTDRAKMAKTGSKAGLAVQQKNNITKSQFLKTFGIIDGKPVRDDRNTSARVLALANLTGKMITNQAVRQELGQTNNKVIEAISKIKEGKSSIMFSKNYGNKVLEKSGLNPVSNQNANDRVIFTAFVEEVLPLFVAIPRLKNGKFRLPSDTYGSRSKIVPGYYMTRFQRVVSAVKAGNVQLRNKIYTKEQINQINKAYSVVKFNELQNEINTRRKGAELFVKGLNEAVNSKKGNKQNLRPIQMLLGSVSDGTYHIARMIAPGLGVTNVGKATKREHVLVANNVSDIVIESLTKDNVSLVLPWLLDNYYQINVNEQQDALIDNAYKNSKEAMPPVFYENLNKAIDAKNMSLASDPLIRYTMSNINLSEINWYNGGTALTYVDKKYGFDGVLNYGNNNKISVKLINDILTNFFAKKVTKKQAKKAIQNVSNLKFSKTIGSSETLNNAIRFSRSTKNPTKGMSAWDLDDTLARTKSGVRASIPNVDGTSKPGRKVIFMAGGPGSGKSTVIKGLELKEQGFKIVNQDISLEWLMKNNGLPTDMRDFTSEQASKFGSLSFDARVIAKRKQTKFQGRGDGVIVDGTGNSLQTMQNQVQEFKNKGYDVQMVFVETSLDTALERNRARKERSLKDSIVERTHKSVQKNKEAFKQLFGENFVEVKTDNIKQNDPMPSKAINKMDKFTRSYEKLRLTAEEFAVRGADILEQGGKFDFSEFDIIKEGKQGPLFNEAMKRAKKFGLKDQFIITARPHAAKTAIYRFLDAQGLNIPFDNIITLENSTSEAKALWIAGKVAEGYNDIYFADDALQNVQAVKNMLDQFDVKSKVQQAKVKFSKSMNDQFNDILEDVKGIESDKRFSEIKARKRGASKGKFRVFIPPSHEDFVGLLYNFLGKGEKGNAHRDFFEKALIRPLNRANREYDTARQSIANDYKALNKQFTDVKKKLTKKTPDGDFTFQDAIRVYLWDKHGHTIPGLSKTDQTALSELVMSDPDLQSYAETVNVISKQETYVNPTEGWNSGDIRMDLDDATGRVGRKQFFAEFIENANIIFSQENLNKIEAGYGKGVRESLEDMLYRIETGRNRPTGQNAQVNKLMNYLNGSVGTVMFFNMRSALLQQMSIVNYINFADNNIFAAAKAFANQKQYWADWSFIFNSDMLKQRRGGIQTDINGAELAASLRNSKDISRKLVSKLLELGFLPTQIGDNIAIATGGATYYRNRINTYIKQGMSKKEAEAAAFTDFQDITQSTQQSARPDMVSKQQASVIGKVILNFQNVTSQFNRLGKKAFQDIYNRRITKPNTTQMQSDISNAARITYYFAVQNAIFYTLQTALFAMMFDDDEEDDNKLFLKKRERLINGSIDSVLRGTGLVGGVIATLKNVAIAYARQRDVRYNPDESAVLLEALNLSPVIGIKARKITNAEKTLNYNKKVIDEMETFDIDNPQWSAYTNYVEAGTNIPLNRLYNKTQNVRQGLNNDHAAWERSLMFLGWSQYNLDLENKKMEEIKEKTKSKKKSKKKKNRFGPRIL